MKAPLAAAGNQHLKDQAEKGGVSEGRPMRCTVTSEGLDLLSKVLKGSYGFGEQEPSLKTQVGGTLPR